jgi:rSAM/selenodomain-associated transferase 1
MKGEIRELLMIFTRNPELGRCKTRLAASVGEETALEIYCFLLEHTAGVTRGLKADKRVYFSERIGRNGPWDESCFQKAVQRGGDLGERMTRAFEEGFEEGYEHIIIIGSDLYDLQEEDLKNAFEKLEKSDFVIGPALDGGYYLLGMKRLDPKLFKGKHWGGPTVLKETLEDLKENSVCLLSAKNDVDVLEDIIDHPAFQPFLKQ